jgi:uncharacterized protein (TIGR03118 family)
LVSDAAASNTPNGTARTDAHLVNPWGLAVGVQSAVWVASAGTSTSTLYENQDLAAPRLVVANAAPQADTSRPTGAVFNIGNGFEVTQANRSGTSRVILTHGDASLSAWAPGVSLESTVQVFDGAASGAMYTGLAKLSTEAGDVLLVADFHNRAVDRIDSAFARVTGAGGFVDADLPAGFAPFGIQVAADRIYVAYAQQDALARAPARGMGLGLVNVFDGTGRLVKRLVAAGSRVNAPWGMAIAPGDFGAFSHALLVANTGDGTITAFDTASGQFLGALAGTNGTVLVIDGLHGIAFGNGSAGQPSNALFFTAGPDGGRHGLYGRIDAR